MCRYVLNHNKIDIFFDNFNFMTDLTRHIMILNLPNLCCILLWDWFLKVCRVYKSFQNYFGTVCTKVSFFVFTANISQTIMNSTVLSIVHLRTSIIHINNISHHHNHHVFRGRLFSLFCKKY